MPHAPSPLASKRQSDSFILLALSVIVLFLLMAGTLFYTSVATLRNNSDAVATTHESIQSLSSLLSMLKDTETGQRGFLLTNNESYLEPYNLTLPQIDDQLREVERFYANHPERLNTVTAIQALVQSRLAELQEAIETNRAQGFNAARNLLATNRGKVTMDALRNHIDMLQTHEKQLRNRHIAEMEEAHHTALAGGIIMVLLGIALAVVIAALVQRTAKAARNQTWLQTGQTEFSKAVMGDPPLQLLGEQILKYFAERLDAQVGAVFVRHGDGKDDEFIRSATYGIPENSTTPQHFTAGETLLGQAAKDGRMFVLDDVPEGYLNVSSALGDTAPRYLLIAPAINEDYVHAVLELGFLKPVPPLAFELMEHVSQAIAVAVRTAEYRESLQELLKETQRQAEELQAQSEELRVNNEELEEQSRALQASQSRLEQQQAELEQTNSQLEEQAHILAQQRDALAKAQGDLKLRARELEQASQYKSDFLANMSHELRTPLNSTLILAKLLADNPDENLSAEQVGYAQTIYSSGNDLLVLINDILDLSKIEAGYMEVQPDTTSLSRLANNLAKGFAPLAEQKGLKLVTELAKNCPDTIHTDSKRLEQVLKNLLSNAIKFTQKGKVSLRFKRAGKGKIAISVRDTGIGIAEDHHATVFEAFRQADGNTNRKYGGTGLGLSISRELSRLLGGDIALESTPGKGSTFTITLPETYAPEHVREKTPPKKAAGSAVKQLETAVSSVADEPAASAGYVPQRLVDDDRDSLTLSQRVLLVVEDDAAFAQIMYDLAHELKFQCLIAQSADEALTMAMQYVPDAVVLDIGLPDHSGLTVLDRLKQDARTRHIPVHIVSAHDHTQTALSLGAVGYILKPVKREELTVALQQLEERLVHHMRRVLVVEDDPVQQESLQKLLGTKDVETMAVGTAADCLALLQKETFDCMVLDLSLPDASGYSLLETLSQEDGYSFPPVIVYTGRDLSPKEEEKLRRYSKSIIIKGAKSPERLLDEVTLFLHQVVADLPAEHQKMLRKARNRDTILEGRRILVVEDDIRNVYAVTSIFEPRGATVQIARNGLEALEALKKAQQTPDMPPIDLVLMDVMMPEMDGLTATREIRKEKHWKDLPIIMLTAKAMKGDQERCLEAGANDYMSKPLDVEKLLSLVRVWMSR